MYIFSLSSSSMTSRSLTTWGWLHFFMMAISFLIFCSVVPSLSVSGRCGEVGRARLRIWFILSLFILRFVTLMACMRVGGGAYGICVSE